jgi:phage gpG-like protein
MSSIQVIIPSTLDGIIGKLEALLDPALPAGILDEAQALMLNRIRARFLATESTDGSLWPVSLAALERKASGRDGETLFDTGTLFHSIQAFLDDSPTSRAIGTDVYYGVYHMFGTGNLPVREFLGFSNEDISLYETLCARRVEEALQ